MQIIIDFGEKTSDRAVKGLAGHFGYPPLVMDGEKQIPNPQPVEEFVTAALQYLITGLAQAAEVKATIQTARDAAEDAINVLRQTAKDSAADLAVTVSLQK